jgi:acetylornithine deacetylase
MVAAAEAEPLKLKQASASEVMEVIPLTILRLGNVKIHPHIRFRSQFLVGSTRWTAAVTNRLTTEAKKLRVNNNPAVRYSGSIMSDHLRVSPIDPIRLTRELCEIESTTYHEGAVGDFLADLLAGLGWEVEKTPVPQPPESATAGPRWNVYAGTAGQTPDLVFSTHMDTVPPYIPFSEDADFMYGRGVSDAKGIIAAQVAAAEVLRSDGLRVGLLFVSGEERDSAGAIVANRSPKGSRFLINGEPTDNRLALASKGALRAAFKSTGKMAHSAYPELGDSAVHKLIEALTRVLALPLPSLEDVGPSTINIGQIHGGHAPNVIADKAEAQVLVRTVTDSAPVRAALQQAAAGLAEVEFTLDTPFVRMRAIEGLPTMIAKFSTDIPQLSNWGEPLLLGPGSIHVAHTPHEKLAKKELKEAVELYIQVAKQLLN